MLSQLDRIVTEKAIEILAQRSEISLSVNLSFEILLDESFLHDMQGWLAHYRVPPKRLGFKLEEETIGLDFPRSQQLMEKLNTIGCPIGIDSFTGSRFTLQQWLEMPASIVKVDARSLQKKDGSNRSQRMMASAIAQVSNSMRKVCVAKAISDKQMLKAARDLGFQYVQGFHLKAPDANPTSVPAIALLAAKVLIFLLGLYLLKTVAGIDLFPKQHVWEVIVSFFERLFGGGK